MPEINSTAMFADKNDRKGVYTIRKETRVEEVVTHYHSIDMGVELPKRAKDLVFKNSQGNLTRARTSKVSKLVRKHTTSTNK